LNTAVVLGAAPPKGVALPFLSYGGSHLLMGFFCMGVLLNLSRTPSRTG
ncbi:MAG: FtsW/RodA/SpoVE family cell cycle protein, partial [Desulfoplanes sp.]